MSNENVRVQKVIINKTGKLVYLQSYVAVGIKESSETLCGYLMKIKKDYIVLKLANVIKKNEHILLDNYFDIVIPFENIRDINEGAWPLFFLFLT